MVRSSSSSPSSCDSLSSFDESTIKICPSVKFICSYGGRILPRYPDGRLRYIGGEIRVLTVDRSISFSDLQAKLGDLCGWEKVNLRCQLPIEDLDALVSISSDEDLVNLLEEYDIVGRDHRFAIKIRAFLHPSVAKSPKSATLPRGKASFQFSPFNAVVNQSVQKESLPAAKKFVRIVRSGDYLHYSYPMNLRPVTH